MTNKEQLQKWVDGESIHNMSMTGNDKDGMCCPDFSCCQPELLAPKDTRLAFQTAYLSGDQATMDKMLSGFFSKLLMRTADSVGGVG